MPHVTEARCGACTVTGGCEVTTDAEAREYSSAMLPPRLVEVGEILEEEPCVNLDLYQKTFPGRECPRVELDVENEEAATLVQMRIGEDPLASAYFDIACGDLPREEQERILRRVMRAVGDERVQGLLEMRRKKAIEDAKGDA
jgi:hypothetical protein